jgi:hypothetical protein
VSNLEIRQGAGLGVNRDVVSIGKPMSEAISEMAAKTFRCVGVVVSQQ